MTLKIWSKVRGMIPWRSVLPMPYCKMRYFHGEGLSCARLAVGKNSAIVAFDDALDDGVSCVLIDIVLSGGPVEDVVEGEDFVFDPFS